MALASRYNGAAAAGAFYGYTPLVIKVAATSGFAANTGGSGSAIVDGGYEKAVRAMEQFGSIVWLGAQTANTFVAIVDGSTFNTGPGATTTGAYGALRDAMATATGVSVGSVTVTIATVLAGDGTFTFGSP